MRLMRKHHVHLSAPFLLLYFFVFVAFTICASPPSTPLDVGVILDLGSPIGSSSLTAIKLAVSDFYADHPMTTTKLRLHVNDSRGDVVAATAAAVDLMFSNQVNLIIGPQSSTEADFVADLGTQAHVPILSFSATSPSLSSSRAHYFIRTAPSDAAQAQSIAALIHAFNWRRVVPIYEDDFGAAFIPFLVDALDAVNAQVPYRTSIPNSASDAVILTALYRLTTMQTRVFVVHATSSFAPRILGAASEAGMMSEGFAWIITSEVTCVLASLDPSHVLNSMQGVIGVRPYIPKSPELQDFKKRWRREFFKENPTDDVIHDVGTFGVWAYDTVMAVAMAAEAVTETGFDRTGNSTGELTRIGFSKSGERLLDSIREREFDGLGGRFRLVDGERNVTVFEVVNINGEKERVVGYWTAKYGLRRDMNWTDEAREIGPVIWPGEVTWVPKGWVEPTSERRLRIGVPGPVEPGFQAFLNIEQELVTNRTVASGYVIDVFEAAVAQLPYALVFDYVEFQNGQGSTDYDNLVRQVFLEKFDAVVGDVTITANRAEQVDFTLPYTESGISMVVRLKGERSKNTWIFLKPLTKDLWLVSLAFFVFTGVVLWILEHRINPEFRGPPAQHIGSVFYFSFSTLVFAHRETLVSNLSRVVVIIWVFVVLILQSSYIASLTSMLTVQKLQPTLTDINQLKKDKEFVGYLKDSFVHKFLLNMNFSESQLRPYKSPQQYAEALAKGSSNGGVSAIIDEIPYLKILLSDYCDTYTMTGPTFKTGGFGFVFPRGSPIVPDLSRAILNITEGEQMMEIEKKWFGDQTSCPDNESTLSSNNSLDFKSFWGLFMITGIASLVSLLIFLASFLYKHRDVYISNASRNSISQRLLTIARVFDQKDLSSYTFRKPEQKDEPMTDIINHPASPFDNSSESPFSMSTYVYEGETPLTVPTSPSVDVPHVEMSTAIG